MGKFSEKKFSILIAGSFGTGRAINSKYVRYSGSPSETDQPNGRDLKKMFAKMLRS